MAGVFFERQGAEVEFPATSNHPSADLRINGEWFQAKCTTSLAIIRRHFERNPDVPVLVNEDIAGHFATDPRVMGIPGVTSDAVRASTNQALSDAAEILDFEICLYVPASTAARVAFAWFKGDTDLVGAATEAGMGTTGRALGAGMGKALAASAVVATGLTGWPAIILPLAAAVGGSIGGRSATTWLKQTILGRGPTAALRQSVGAYCVRAVTRLENILSISADQLALWRKLQAGASAQWHGIIDNWISRLEDQRDRQALALRRLRAGARDPESLEKHGGPLHSAYRAAILAGGAGVTPRELFHETQDLTMAIEAYQKAMQRHFLRTV
ncbi:hypothetical protein [Roseomonas sp. HF4]|uniref:hypothetical protein n=1 Tax=Roseomonas sp. HF4 TaxID=2562313 RepID=UPI0010C129BC|nr:hypothetical protein [Roseomonas sp. HF4]